MTIKRACVAAASLAVAACGGGSGGGAPVNQAPAIDEIGDVSIVANQPGSDIGFGVSDEDVATLTLEAQSDNPAVVAQSGIVLGGSATARTVNVTPVIDTTGDAFVTVTVTDSDGLMDGTTFVVTVTPESKSLKQFSRSEFALDGDGDAALINAVDFAADAVDDDFSDLLAD